MSATQPAALGGVPQGFVWPEPPPRRGQSPVLFDDGYEEGWAKCVATIKAMLSAAPAHDAPAIAAKPLEWDQDSGFQWTDKHHGFSIIEEPGDDKPFSAAWGEGDADQFATLDEAKAWCQAQIDAYFSKHAVIAAKETTTEGSPQ